MFKTIRHHVRNLQPGSSFTVSGREISCNVIRNYASCAAAAVGGKFSVHYDRNANTYTVTRHA